MLVHVINQTDQVMPIPVVLQRLDLGYSTLRNSSETFFIENVFVSIYNFKKLSDFQCLFSCLIQIFIFLFFTLQICIQTYIK